MQEARAIYLHGFVDSLKTVGDQGFQDVIDGVIILAVGHVVGSLVLMVSFTNKKSGHGPPFQRRRLPRSGSLT
jgi:hypothetical protein